MNIDKKTRSQAAKVVCNLPEFKILIEEVKRELFLEWGRTNAGQTDDREALHRIVCGIDNFVVKAEKYANETDIDKDFENARPTE